MRKFTVVALMLSGLSLAAGEPSDILRGEGVSFRTGAGTERHILKVKSSFSGASIMREEDRESHGPGMFANVGLFMPRLEYMDPYFIPGEPLWKTGYALEVGNYFRFYHTDRLGVGLRATWIQLGYTGSTDTSYVEGNAFGSPLRIGPQASYLLTEQIGLDVFYQLGAQYNMTWVDGENVSFLGITHEAGLGVRFMFLTAGAAMKFGSLPNVDSSDPTNMPVDDFFKYSAAGLRIFLGIQL